jgi:repressor LexA
MKKPLTSKQNKVLEVLKSYVVSSGESPTLDQVRTKLGVKSLRTVTQYLDTLESKGYIMRRKNEKRNIEIVGANSAGLSAMTVSVPVIASVGCDDLSVFAQEEHDEYIEVDKQLVDNSGDIVAVRASGDSMVDAGINSGDYILVQFTENVKNGDRVAAIIDDMITVKRLERRPGVNGQAGVTILYPESKDPKYKPIVLRENFRITGKVLCVIPRLTMEATEVVPLRNNETEDYY